MAITPHNRSHQRLPTPGTGCWRLLPVADCIWAGARLTSCGFMAAPAAS